MLYVFLTMRGPIRPSQYATSPINIASYKAPSAVLTTSKKLLNLIQTKETIVGNSQFFEDLSLKIRGLISGSPAGDLEKNLRALLQGAFTKLELVSREEFEVQAEVLRVTRERLEALQARVAQLENITEEER